jgi:hypothetical protein
MISGMIYMRSARVSAPKRWRISAIGARQRAETVVDICDRRKGGEPVFSQDFQGSQGSQVAQGGPLEHP